jgi:predicted exporter
MEPPRQKWTARALLLAGAAVAALSLWKLDLAKRVSTDVLDLVPSDERSPELSIVRSLAGKDEARILLLALTVPPRPGEAQAIHSARGQDAAALFSSSLAKSPAIAEALPISDPGPRDQIARVVFSERMELLLPALLEARRAEYAAQGMHGDWSRWLAERSARELEAHLSKAEAMATQDILTADPLLLIPGLAEKIGGLSGSGFGSGRVGDTWLIWAKSRGSPLSEEGQEPVFNAIDASLATANAASGPAELSWTGIARFAAASRHRTEREFKILNVLSILLVIAVATACVRKAYRALHLVPVVAGSILGAWTITAAVWPHLHILVFVIGSLLAGVAVDYGFYLYLQPRRTPDEPYRDRARRLIRPLLASALTTVIGFSFLLWSELPLIRQVGVFVSAGLICALATALLWFAQLDDSFLETRDFIRRRPAGGGATARNLARCLLVLGAAIALLGPWRLHWKDDIRELEIPTPELKENDAQVRALFGQKGEGTVYLTWGPTLTEARASLESFLAWHDSRHPGSALFTLGSVIPTERQWQHLPQEMGAAGAFERDFRAALSGRGFDPDAFQPFFDAWRSEENRGPGQTYEKLINSVAGALHGPLSALVHSDASMSWFVTLSGDPVEEEPPESLRTVSDSQVQKLNKLFARYRISALRLSAVGLGFVGASVFVLYGIRRGIRIFAIPAGACLFAFGVFGLAGATMNLFNLLGAFLGVCLSHNYAIFTAESSGRGEEPPPSIRMSALAAASSFGILALSGIPVVASLGATVAVIVLAALAITELAPIASSGAAGTRRSQPPQA